MAIDEGRRTVDGVSRRSLLRGGLLAGAGLATLGAASGVLTGTAKAATNPQPGWGFCIYCSTMWWVADGSSSACSGNTPNKHHSVANGSDDYAILFSDADATPTGNPQSGWTWCKACQGLFWGQTKSLCAGNASQAPGEAEYLNPHVPGSGTNYALYSGGGSTGIQSGWRWCTQCHLLFWPGINYTDGGSCPAFIDDDGGYSFNSEHTGGGTVYENYVVGTWVVS
jgi:hypothetical protein